VKSPAEIARKTNTYARVRHPDMKHAARDQALRARLKSHPSIDAIARKGLKDRRNLNHGMPEHRFNHFL
jgi:hypothetical protein